MNILLTCVGRRNYLIEFFRNALAERGRVYAVDASAEAPALQEADQAWVLPLIESPDYVEQLVALCDEYKIRLLFSLNDLELPLLAANYERFLAVGTLPVISPLPVINLCFDKWATVKFLEKLGLKAPKTYISLKSANNALEVGDLHFPVVVKPRWGSASIGILYPENKEELQWAYKFSYKKVDNSILAKPSSEDPKHSIMIQEKSAGIEYGLDIVNDLQGRYITTFVKRKLSMRAGETDRAVTEYNPELIAIGEALGQSIEHVGNMDCDVIVTDDGPVVLELNPRFGGGYPFSHVAGANLPAALIAWALGEPVDPDWLTIAFDVTAAKCDRLVLKTI